jgi:hypothetical protein
LDKSRLGIRFDLTQGEMKIYYPDGRLFAVRGWRPNRSRPRSNATRQFRTRPSDLERDRALERDQAGAEKDERNGRPVWRSDCGRRASTRRLIVCHPRTPRMRERWDAG